MTESRRIGSLETPPLILGGNVFGWTADESASFAVLDAFVAGGGRMIDTAAMYSSWIPGHRGGESERVIGAWLKRRGRRDDVLIGTKVHLLPGDKILTAGRIASAIDESLANLGTDHVDLYIIHRDDGAPDREIIATALDALVKAGKVREIGASNFTADRLASAIATQERLGTARYVSVQNLYSLVERDEYEGAMQSLCVDRGIAMTPYYALAAGYLSGKYRSEADLKGGARDGTVAGYVKGNGPRVLAALDAVAADTGATLPQIALAWLAAQPGVAAPIASATSVEQVESLLGAMALRLSPGQIATLDAASAPVPATP
jgi:aryl-alcohol dehydrogenase-like predicted oxidoreductase